LREPGQCFAAFLAFFPLCLTLLASFLVLPFATLALRLAFLPRPMTGSFCVLRHQRCHIRTAFPSCCRRRGAPVAPCSTRGEAQTFPISRLSVAARRSPCAARSTRGRRHVPHLLPRARNNDQYRSAGMCDSPRSRVDQQRMPVGRLRDLWVT